MTLVAGLSVGGLPAFIGDLLVSWRLPSVVDLPTQWQAGEYPGLDKDYAAGLAQKLVIVRPYLVIAWAGLRINVDLIISKLDSVLPADLADLNDHHIVLSILDTCGSGTEIVALLIWDNAIRPFCVGTRGFELDDKRIYLLGSGGPEFFDYIQSHPDLMPSQEVADGVTARAILLRFAARAMTLQLLTGAGLKDSWGGGFEVVYPGRDGFRKIDNFMCRSWMIDESGICRNSGRSFFVRYYGHDLHMSWFNPEEKTYVVRSPLSVCVELPLSEEVSPEWTVDVFVMRKTASIVEFVRYQPPQRTADKVEMKNGCLVGWHMDKAYVDYCAARAIGVAKKGEHFEIGRC